MAQIDGKKLQKCIKLTNVRDYFKNSATKYKTTILDK